MELTFNLRPPEDQQTDQQTRAVYKPAAKKKRKQPQRQQNQQLRELPRVRPRETPPPPMEAQPVPPVVTLQYQQPVAPTVPTRPSPAVHRPAPPTVDDRVKRTPRRTRPTITSSPKLASPTPMDTPSGPDPDLPRVCDYDTTPIQLKRKFWNTYYARKIWTIRHPERGLMTIFELNLCGNWSSHPTYVMKTEESPYTFFKNHHSKYHHSKWWNYVDSYSGFDPLPEKQRPSHFTRLRQAATEGKMHKAMPKTNLDLYQRSESFSSFYSRPFSGPPAYTFGCETCETGMFSHFRVYFWSVFTF